MAASIRTLLVEDVADDAALIERELRQAGIRGATRRVDSERAFREALSAFAPDIILSDHSLPTFGAGDALRIALLETPDTPLIIVTAASTRKRPRSTSRPAPRTTSSSITWSGWARPSCARSTCAGPAARRSAPKKPAVRVRNASAH